MPKDSGQVKLIITSHQAQLPWKLSGANQFFDPGEFTGAVPQPDRGEGQTRGASEGLLQPKRQGPGEARHRGNLIHRSVLDGLYRRSSIRFRVGPMPVTKSMEDRRLPLLRRLR